MYHIKFTLAPNDDLFPGTSGKVFRNEEGTGSPLSISGTYTSKPLFSEISSAVIHGFFVRPF